MFVTGAGPLLMVLDPFAAKFVQWFRPEPEEEIAGMSFAEDTDGFVYAATYPRCKLIRVDLRCGEAVTLCRLNPKQQYAMTLAAAGGWIYGGIGTQTAGISAYCTLDGTVASFPSAERGSGAVHLGLDGKVYGSLPAPGEAEEERWFQFSGKDAMSVKKESVSPSRYKGTGYQRLHGDLRGSRHLVRYQLAEGELVIADEERGEETVLPLSYEGNGAQLSPIALGPDGRLYGTSNHPLHLYRYNPRGSTLLNYGGKLVAKGGGGNICAYASQGALLLGIAYAGGHLHLLDTDRPASASEGPGRNPRLIYSDERVHRPRCALAHPDGTHVLYGGFPGYGAVGGALGIVHVPSETVQIMEHETIVPFQSTVSLAALRSGDVLGGTSILTPGGAEPIAQEALLYRFDWNGRCVKERWAPIPQAKEISQLVCDSRDRVHGLTLEGVYFVFDPGTGELLHRHDVSAWGAVVRQGLLFVQRDTGAQIVGLLSRGLFAVNPDTFELNLIAVPPKEATAGIAYDDGYIYYGSGSELWSFNWKEKEVPV